MIDEFDLMEFSVSIIRVIDSIRSKGRTGAEDFTESRINAFYRAIGLPAVIVNVRLDKNGNKIDPELEKDNNGNSFTSEEFEITNDQKNALGLRKTIFLKEVTDEEIESFLDFNTSSIRDGIPDENDNPPKRKRGHLFPMIVDDEIEIYPKSRRIGPAFSKDIDLINDKTTYSRPLIEMILSLRLKSDNLNDTDKQDKVTLALSEEVFKLGEEITSVLTNKKNIVGKWMDTTSNLLNDARSAWAANVAPTADSVAQQNQATKESADKKASLQLKLEAQQSALLKRQSRLSVFDFDDTSDINNGVSFSRNLKGPIFATHILDIVLGTSVLDRGIKETQQRISKRKKTIKEVHRNLDLILGTYSGISGTDILAVIIALFEVDLDILISLLNKKNKENLKATRGITGGNTKTNTAVDKLQKKVTEVIKDIHDKAQDSRIANDKNRSKK